MRSVLSVRRDRSTAICRAESHEGEAFNKYLGKRRYKAEVPAGLYDGQVRHDVGALQKVATTGDARWASPFRSIASAAKEIWANSGTF